MIKSIRNFILSKDPSIQEDLAFGKKRFKEVFNRDLNIINPKSLNEKIQWLKLFDRKNYYSTLADKYEVREYVRKCFSSEILNEVYGVYNSFDEINFNTLPNSFVIKATHGSGWNIICDNKNELDLDSAKKDIEGWLKENYYSYGKEFVYKNIKPRIIVEKYLDFSNGDSLYDYKYFCFNGEPKFIQVDIDRFTNHTRNLYDTTWKKIPCQLHYQDTQKTISQPSNLSKMLEIASKLSKEIKFCRIDLYDLSDKVVFGEITFYPGNGLEKFNPEEYDFKFGEYLNL